MVSLFWKLFYKNFFKDKLFTAISLLGLTLGISASLIIYLWTTDELSYDTFHKDAENIYRIIKVEKLSDGEKKSIYTPALLPFELKRTYPQITHAVSIYGGDEKKPFRYKEEFTKFQVIYTTEDFFKVFSFPVIRGNDSILFKTPNSIVISKKCAEQLFGTVNCIGFEVDECYYKTKKFIVSAVLDIPANSHINFEVLCNYSADPSIYKISKQWNVISTVNYIRLQKNKELTDQQRFQMQNFIKDKAGINAKLYYQPLLDIHLFTNFTDDFSVNNGSYYYVRIFSLASLLLLIVTGLNFIILVTARSENRFKEIAIKKLYGTQKSGFILQFVSETTIYTVFSFMLALLLISIILPWFNQFNNRQIELSYNRQIFVYLIVAIVSISIISASYITFYLSSFSSLSLFKGVSSNGNKQHISMLITPMQLIISLAFIICTLTFFIQLKYMQRKDKGLDLSNIIAISANSFIYKYDVVKAALTNNPNIYSVCAAGKPPINYTFNKHNEITWEGKSNDQDIFITIQCVDPSYLKTFGIKLIKGSFLPENMNVAGHFDGKYNDNTPFVINETAEKLLGYSNPIGKKFSLGYGNGTGFITGVVKDFHFQSLANKIEPLVMFYYPEDFFTLYVKINPKKTQEVIDYIKTITAPYNKEENFPFDYYFLEDLVNRQYTGEKNLMVFSFLGTVVSILLSLMGLTGMIAYSLEKKRKVIAIKKVFGASSGTIVFHFLRNMLILSVISFTFALAISIYFTNHWLQNFAYKTNPIVPISIFVLVTATILILAITTLIVYKTSHENPIKNLKYE